MNFYLPLHFFCRESGCLAAFFSFDFGLDQDKLVKLWPLLHLPHLFAWYSSGFQRHGVLFAPLYAAAFDLALIIFAAPPTFDQIRAHVLRFLRLRLPNTSDTQRETPQTEAFHWQHAALQGWSQRIELSVGWPCYIYPVSRVRSDPYARSLFNHWSSS